MYPTTLPNYMHDLQSLISSLPNLFQERTNHWIVNFVIVLIANEQNFFYCTKKYKYVENSVILIELI